MAAKTGELPSREDFLAFLTRKPILMQAGRYAGSLLLGLAMGAAPLFGGCGPFGVALAGAVGTDVPGLLCLLGIMGGYVLGGGFLAAVRYIAAALLVFTAELLFRAAKLSRLPWFIPSASLVFMVLTGLLYRQDLSASVPWLLRLVTESLLACGGSCAFRCALLKRQDASESAQTRRRICLAALGACLFMSLAGVGIMKAVYVGPFLALMTVMLTAYGGGAMLGCVVGAAFGLAMDVALSPVLFRAAAYAFGGLAAGVVARRGRLAFALSFCTANGLAVLFAWGMEPPVAALYECFSAAVVFMLLPSAAVNPVCALLRMDSGRGETAFRRYQAARLERMAEAFRRLFEVVSVTASPESTELDVDAVFDRSSDILCAGCGNKELCWQMEYRETLDSLRQAAEPMQSRGSLRAEDLPESFRIRCQRSDEFVNAVNTELRCLLYRQQFRSRLREAKIAAYGQFSDLSRIMHGAARELCGPAGPDPQIERRLDRFMKGQDVDGSCSVFRDGRGRMRVMLEGAGMAALAQEEDYLERISSVVGVRLCRLKDEEPDRLLFIQAEPLAVSVGIAAIKKDGESISGDRSAYFKTDAGILCVILSDGMGCGARAAVESSAAVKILEEFLRAGVEPETAMGLLNSVELLKNGDDWSYATVDLCCIDLFTGQTCFYKYGAAPSYVKTGRAIRRVKGKSLAAGMAAGESSAPDVIKMRLRPGHVALIASDGVMVEDSDQWLREILAQSEGKEMKLVARQTLQAALQRFGNSDDMTAMAIRVEERP